MHVCGCVRVRAHEYHAVNCVWHTRQRVHYGKGRHALLVEHVESGDDGCVVGGSGYALVRPNAKLLDGLLHVRRLDTVVVLDELYKKKIDGSV